jgi:adenylate cyclase
MGGGDPIPLLKDRLVIGRRESCDICLRFANISTKHCELILEQGYWKVRDLQSTNGVKVNGERVLEKRVYPGDELTIAKHRYHLNYTPTTARSADAEVDELHEDIMRFSLLERAGLTKQGDKTTRTPRRPAPEKTADDEAIEYLGAPTAKTADEDDSSQHPGKSSTSLAEEAIEVVSPAASAQDLSDDEFLKIVAEEEKKRKQQKPS